MSVEAAGTHRGASVDPARLGIGDRGHVQEQRAEQVRAFQGHAGGFVVGMTVMFGVNLVTNISAGIAGSLSAWWSVWAFIGWGAGVAIHGLVVWLHRPALPAGGTVGGES